MFMDYVHATSRNLNPGKTKKVHRKKQYLSCSLQFLFEEVGEGQWEVIGSLTVPPGWDICLLQGMGLCDCGSWLGKSKIHRPGCQERQAIQKGRLEPPAEAEAAVQGGISSPHKLQFCCEGLSADCTRYTQIIEDDLSRVNWLQTLSTAIKYLYSNT